MYSSGAKLCQRSHPHVQFDTPLREINKASCKVGTMSFLSNLSLSSVS